MTVIVKIELGKSTALLAAGLLFFVAAEISSENFTMHAVYPAPSGVYKKLTTTERTVLARDGGDVILASSSGKVGVGAQTPVAKLDVAGGVRVGHDSGTCTSSRAGTLRWPSATDGLQVCNGTSWVSLQGQTLLPGMLCGGQDVNGTLRDVRCAGYSPASSCPSGFTPRIFATIDGNNLHSCVKD